MELEKEELKSKVSRRMEIINRRAELNEIETRKKMIKETFFFGLFIFVFWKINRTHWTLARLTKKKERTEKQI